MIGAVLGKRQGPRACFMLLFCATMFCATALASRRGGSNSVETEASSRARGDSPMQLIARPVTKEVVKDFASNSHSRPVLMHAAKA